MAHPIPPPSISSVSPGIGAVGTFVEVHGAHDVQRYGVQLFHNFTYFLNDPDNGDQFEQHEERWTTGAKLTHRRLHRAGERALESLFGVDVRQDSVGGPLGLYLTRHTERLATVRADDVNQVSVGFFGRTEVEWSRVLRTTFGLRGDVYRWRVASDHPMNSGSQVSGILSPKVSAVLGPWGGTEFYANWGLGYHSNSALGIVLQVDPATGDSADPSTPFARAHGAEFGVRTVAMPKTQTDSGSTEAGPASRRTGVEITNYLYPHPWATFDIDVSFSRARFAGVDRGEDFVPGALNRVISGGVAVNPPQGIRSGPFGGIRLRHFGPRPLIEDNSVRSKSTSIVNGEVGYQVSPRVRLGLEGFNLFDAEVSDIDYFFESRLAHEPEPVEDIHFHAAIPRSVRVTLQVSF